MSKIEIDEEMAALDRAIEAAGVKHDRAIEAAGVKHDSGKPRWTLLPMGAVSRVVDVLTFGAKKYSPDNWQKIEGGHERYLDAAFRHLTAYTRGERNDPESGIHHLAHVVCCLLFLMWFDGER